MKNTQHTSAYLPQGRYATKFALSGKWNRFAVKYLLRKCEMSACSDVGKFHFTSSTARYFTMCAGTLFHVLRKQNISLYAFVSTNAVLVKKKGRGIFAILRPFPVGGCFIFSYCFIAGTPPWGLSAVKSVFDEYRTALTVACKVFIKGLVALPCYPFSPLLASSVVGWHLLLIGQPAHPQPQPQEEFLPLRFERTIPNIMRATNATTQRSTAILPIVSPIFVLLSFQCNAL